MLLLNFEATLKKAMQQMSQLSSVLKQLQEDVCVVKTSQVKLTWILPTEMRDWKRDIVALTAKDIKEVWPAGKTSGVLICDY